MSEFDKGSMSKTQDPRFMALDRLEVSALFVINPTRMAELDSAYRRALEVAICGNYAEGDPNVAKTVARIILSIWQQDPSCNFLRLTNRAIQCYREYRALETHISRPRTAA